MSKRVFIFSLYIVFSILFSSVSVENKGKLKIKGRLLDALGEPIVGATIELKEFGNPVLTVNSNPVGKFVLEAEYQKKYTLHFSQTGYYAMFIQLDTDIPIPKSDKNYTYQPYLNLISDTVESFNANVFKKPIIRVVYNNIQDYFSESQEDLAEFVQKANDPEGMILKGNLKSNEISVIDSATVSLLENNQIIQTIPVDSNGEFEVKVYYNRNSQIKIDAPNHYPTVLDINTQVPQAVSKNEFEVIQEIPLTSKTTEYINPKAFEMPVTKLTFDPVATTFKTDTLVEDTFLKVLHEPKKLPVDITGVITDTAGKPVANALVKMIEKGVEVAQLQTKADGTYAFKTDYNKDITIEIESNEHHPIEIDVNTERQATEFKRMKLDAPKAILYKTNDALVDPKLFERPLAFIEIDAEKDVFVEDTIVREEFKQAVVESIKKNEPKVALANEVYPEEYEKFTYRGQVFMIGTGLKIHDALIKVYVGPVEILNVKSDKKGQVTFDLEYQKKYDLEVTAEGYLPMKFIINTNVPKNEVKNAITHKGEIPMFDSESEGINKTAPSSLPFTEIYFDSLRGKFSDDQATIAAFETMLQTEEEKLIPKLLVVKGAIDEFSRKTHRDIKGYVKLNNKVTDTLEIDRDGNFFVELDYNTNYELSFESPNHYQSIVTVNTQTNNTNIRDTTNRVAIKTIPLTQDIDPLYFQTPIQSVQLSPSGKFEENKQTYIAFNKQAENAQRLAELAQKRLTVNGVVRDLTEKRVRNAKIILVESNQKIDSTTTNRRGEFSIKTPYHKNAQIQVETNEYYQAFIEVNSNMPPDSVTDISVNLPDVVLVSKTEEDIDPLALQMPNQAITYNTMQKTFVPDSAANDNFMAVLFEPKREKERQLAEAKAANAATKIATTPSKPRELGTLTAQLIPNQKEIVAKRPDEDKLMKLLQDDIAAEKAKEESQAEKSEASTDFFKMFSRPDSSLPVLDIKNALLDAELLTQVEIKDVEAPEEDEIDEDFLKQQEAFIDFTQSIARDFALRRGGAGIDIKIDSVFSVHRPVRVYTTYSGEKIRLFERNKIIENGEITELVKVTSWYVIDDFYLNGNRISESEYYAILSKYTSNNSN